MNLSNLIMFFKGLGISPKTFTPTDLLVRFMRFMPLFIEHFHIIEQGPPNTGKSFVTKIFPEIFEMVKVLTVAKIFGSASGKDGYISNVNKAIFFDEISNLNNSDISTDLKSALKSYLNGDSFSRGEQNFEQTTSCYFAGNTIDSVQDNLDVNPNLYNKNNFDNLPDFFKENAMVERVICNPGWLLKKTEEFNMSQEDNESELKWIVKFIKDNRCSKEKNIRISFTNNTRDCKKARKIITGFIISLYNKEFSTDNISEIMEFSKFIVDLGYGKYSKFWNTDSGKKLLLNFLPLYLPKNSSIKRIFFSQDRILVITKENPSKIYKIAINKYGIIENKNEIELFNKNEDISKIIANIETYGNNYNTVVQDFYEFLDLKEEFKHTGLIPIEVEIINLKEEIKKLNISKNILKEDINELTLKYNRLVDVILALRTGFPVHNPEKISSKRKATEDSNYNDFINRANSLNIKITSSQIGYKNGEYKIMNFSHLKK